METILFWQRVEARLDGRPWTWLARKLGVTIETLRLRRQTEPRTEVVLALASVFDCTIEDLTGGGGNG